MLLKLGADVKNSTLLQDCGESEKWSNVTFNGDINNFQQVSNFLSEYLEEAKLTYEEIACEYESYLWDLMD